jgi:hypothetical protein
MEIRVMKSATAERSVQKNGAKASIVLVVFAFLACAGLQAQTFKTVSTLSFTGSLGGTNAVPQIVTVSSSGAAFPFFDAASTTSGGNWLSVGRCGNPSLPCTTPYAVDVHATAAGLAAGTYQGKIVFTDANNHNINVTVPVTLTVLQSNVAFLDNLPGALSFSFKTGGNSSAQSFQIRNAGSGTLNWTLSASTADGRNWLGESSSSGTAPSMVSVSITPGNLPGGGLVAGTFVGELTLQTSGDSTTIPISVAVGSSVFEQVNPISFTMPVGGKNPLPQVLSIDTADNSATTYFDVAVAANGGNWLSIPPCGNPSLPCITPHPFAVAIQNASTLAAGTYMGEVTVYQDTNPSMSINVPITLHVVASGAYFNDIGGALSFTMVKGATTVTLQTIEVENAGIGSLNWTATATTADGGAWLTTNPSSGTAPSEVSVGVTASNLPGGGAIAGVFVGQLLFQTGTDITTVPIAVTVAPNIFNQLNPISFTMPVGGANPLPQNLTISNTEGNPSISFFTVANTASGGNWLSVLRCSNPSLPCATPYPVTVNVVNASTLPAGTYTGEVSIYQDTNPQMSLTIPVTLNVVASGAFFNNLGGALSFSLVENGMAVPHTIEIENGGSGILNWTVKAETSDGDAWLSTTPASGTAPSEVKVSITTANLPGGGALAGTFTGQLLFQTGTDTTTIPVSVTVGANVFLQVDPISFTMPAGGANPLPQILTINNSVSNSSLSFFTRTATATSTSWLSVPACSNPSLPCLTPFPVTVNVVNASTLPAGTYTGEVIVYQDTDPAMSVTVPVTLNVISLGAFFSNLPGQLSFTMKQNATEVTSQPLQIGNAGSGALKFTITPSTSDGGAWLTVSPLSSTAPKTITVGVNPLNLPGAGKLAGTFVGQLVLVAGSDTETIPITVTVGNGAFSQLNPLNFVMPVGGANPLPQILTVPGINNTALRFYQVTTTATGGNWLNVPACGNPSLPCSTSYPLGVGVKNASTLAAGTYTGQVTIYEDTDPAWSMTAPVTLTVVPTSEAFFDNLPGQTSFSLVTGSTSTPSQTIALGNGGIGTLAWKIATNTADGAKWFTVTPTSGTNAGSYTVSVNVQSLPGGGKNAGTFIGQTLLETATGNVTIPVAVTVNNPVFVQVRLVSFNAKVGTSPAPHLLAIHSSGSAIGFFQAVATGKGGNWMSISTCGNPSLPCSTPTSLTVNVNSSALPVGTYFADISIYQDSNPGESMTIPVVLTIAP